MHASAWLARSAFAASFIVGSALAGCGGAPRPAAQSSAPPPREDVEVHVPQKVDSVATGDFHTCAVIVGGTVMCWGRDRQGELGDGGTAGNRARPRAVPSLEDVVQVAAGDGFSCARQKSGVVRCWGSGKILGDDRDVEKIRPTEVAGVRDAVELVAGGFVACARNESGAVRCWGTSAIQKGAPTAGAEEVAVAGAHACARTLEGKITCWGEGLWAAGAKNIDQSGAPIAKATALSTGDSFVCAVVDGQARCWGRNDQGELGAPPDKDTRTKPMTVKNAAGLVRLASAEARTCALTGEGGVRCWGSNQEGELGRGTRSVTGLPDDVAELHGVDAIAVGAGHACARTKDAALFCWGENREGQLGDGTHEARTRPVAVSW